METIHTTMLLLAVAWAVVTTILIFVWIYRSTLETREEDQLFLNSSGDMMAKEQREIVSRIEKLRRPITALLVIAVTLMVVVAGLWIWQGLNRPTFS